MTRRFTIAATVAVAVLAAATACYAVWSSTQSGTASSRVAQAGAYTFSAGPPPGAPGGPPPADMIAGPGSSGSGSISVINTSSADMTLRSYHGVVGTITVANADGCDPSEFSVDTTSQTLATPAKLPAGATTVVELPHVVSLAAAAPLACAGANVTFDVSVTVSQP